MSAGKDMREVWCQLNHSQAWTEVQKEEVTISRSPKLLVIKSGQESKFPNTLAEFYGQFQKSGSFPLIARLDD